MQLLNAATGGWGTADSLAYLEAFGERVAPHLIVVFVSLDDFGRSERRPLYTLSHNGRVIAQDLSNRRSVAKMVLGRTPGYFWLLEHSHLLQFLRRLALTQGSGRDRDRAPRAEEMADLTLAGAGSGAPRHQLLAEALFARFKAWSHRHDTPLLVMTTGWPSVNYPWLDASMKRLAIPFADLKPLVAGAMAKDIQAYEIPNDHHPTAEGAALIAAAAWPHLRDAVASLLTPETPLAAAAP